ncbi:MAG TPA: hypothetical protein VIQ31_19770, partial [Phormidium sp.]
GDLQFDSTDEAIYHEYLVIPAIALAKLRFPDTELRVLICGGGDGLAVREVLRFPEVSRVDLVDYDSEVLELGKTIFEPFNAGSLTSDRLSIYIQDAWDFITEVPTALYHVIIGDFTYPTSAEGTNVYSLEWFQQVNLALENGGIFCTNAVSPENRAAGFWCLYQTLLAAELMARPLQLNIPSFRRLGYGNWGFFLTSQILIERAELEDIKFPENLQAINQENLLSAFVFDSAIANIRHQVTIHSLQFPELFYYLLNPIFQPEKGDNLKVDFLEIHEVSNGRVGTRNWLKLESTAKAWLEHFTATQDLGENLPDLNRLVPIQHRYHSPEMQREWLGYLQQLLAEIDINKLIKSTLSRVQELPPHIAKDLKNLSETIRSGQPLTNLSPSTTQFLMMLSVTLLMANLVAPDTVFAKGYYSGGSSGYYSGSSDSSEPIILSNQQSLGLQLMLWGAGLLVALGLTFVSWSNSNDD